MSKNTEDINKKFEKAAIKIKASNLNLDNDTLLTLYGYYKQATDGDCNIEAPSFFDFKGKAKYEAWVQHKGVGLETAMKKYIKKVKSLLKNN